MSRTLPALGVARVEILRDDDHQQVGNVLAGGVRDVALVAAALHARRRADIVGLRADVFVPDVMHQRPVPALDVHGDMRRADDVAIGELDICDLGRCGLGPDLNRSPPVAPEYHVVNAHVADRRCWSGASSPLSTMASSNERTKELRMTTSWQLQISMPSAL